MSPSNQDNKTLFRQALRTYKAYLARLPGVESEMFPRPDPCESTSGWSGSVYQLRSAERELICSLGYYGSFQLEDVRTH